MVKLINEIASEMAYLYPEASPKQISEAIIRTIESEIIPNAFKKIKLPSKREIKLEELRIRTRYRKMKKKKRIEKIEEIRRYKELKNILTQTYYVSDSPYTYYTFYNGGKDTLELQPIQFNDSPRLLVEKKPKETVEHYLEKVGLNTRAMGLITVESSTITELYRKEFISLIEKLEKLREKVKSKQTLSLNDLRKINLIIETADEETLNRVYNLLGEDIQLRKEKYDINVIEELYRGEEYIPINLREKRPKDLIGLIHERIKAILLCEEKVLYRSLLKDFINQKLSYEDYMEKTEGVSKIVDELWTKT